MITTKISSISHASGRLAVAVMSLVFSHTALAWPQEYLGTDSGSNTGTRYTWDNDNPPSYNDILAERLKSSSTNTGEAGLFVGSGATVAVQDTTSMGIGWNFPVYGAVTTGPEASLRRDNDSTKYYNGLDDVRGLQGSAADPLLRASISTLGWRVNYNLGTIKPWAKISFNQQYGENVWRAQPGMSMVSATGQEGSWTDVSLGADMALYHNVAAWASMSQSEGTTLGDSHMYNIGVSASF